MLILKMRPCDNCTNIAVVWQDRNFDLHDVIFLIEFLLHDVIFLRKVRKFLINLLMTIRLSLMSFPKILFEL